MKKGETMKNCSTKTFDRIAKLALYLPYCSYNSYLGQANVVMFGKLVAFEEDFYDERGMRTVSKCKGFFKLLGF